MLSLRSACDHDENEERMFVNESRVKQVHTMIGWESGYSFLSRWSRLKARPVSRQGQTSRGDCPLTWAWDAHTLPTRSTPILLRTIPLDFANSNLTCDEPAGTDAAAALMSTSSFSSSCIDSAADSALERAGDDGRGTEPPILRGRGRGR